MLKSSLQASNARALHAIAEAHAKAAAAMRRAIHARAVQLRIGAALSTAAEATHQAWADRASTQCTPVTNLNGDERAAAALRDRRVRRRPRDHQRGQSRCRAARTPMQRRGRRARGLSKRETCMTSRKAASDEQPYPTTTRNAMLVSASKRERNAGSATHMPGRRSTVRVRLRTTRWPRLEDQRASML